MVHFVQDVSTRESHPRTARMTDRPVAADTPFVVRSSDRVSIVRVGDVQWIESAGNYVGVHTSCGRLLTRETMAHIAARLPAHLFVRIHRGAIVNVQGLVEIRRWRPGLLIATLRSGARLRVSRTYREGLDRAIARIAATDATPSLSTI
jgi:two-component system LytT family response regulator